MQRQVRRGYGIAAGMAVYRLVSFAAGFGAMAAMGLVLSGHGVAGAVLGGGVLGLLLAVRR